MDQMPYLIPLFLLISLFYSSAGFGGGSSYLALLALFNVSYLTLPKISLACNLIVVTGGLYHYCRGGYLNWRKCLPFVLASVPCAYLGSRIPISKTTFLFLLGISLAVAGLKLLFEKSVKNQIGTALPPLIGIAIGGVLGLVSGLVGIGGGIFLSPLLYFLRWGSSREIAAASSFFIFVNSVSGFIGQSVKSGWHLEPNLIPLLAAVFVGGQIGSKMSAGYLSLSQIRRVTACLILFVAGKILVEVIL